MNPLTRLLLPRDDGGQVYLDHDSVAVIRADHVATAARHIDDTIDRLVLRLARATGHTEAEIRLSEGLNPTHPHQDTRDRPNGRPDPTSEADARPQSPTSRETTTNATGRRHP